MKSLIKTKLIEDKEKLYCEIRDYELGKDVKVIHCKSKDYKKCYHVQEEYMVLTQAKQKKGKIMNTQRSMFYPYTTYKLVRFIWKPKGKIESVQVDGRGQYIIENGVYKVIL